MTTRVDECLAHAPPELCFQIVREIERWPEFLRHYRRVRYLRRNAPGNGEVEIAAWYILIGPICIPTRWTAEFESDESNLTLNLRHLDGITRGLRITWEILPADVDTKLRITHAWDDDGWPLVGSLARTRIAAPFLFGASARRTLTGIAIEAQRLTHASRFDDLT